MNYILLNLFLNILTNVCYLNIFIFFHFVIIKYKTLYRIITIYHIVKENMGFKLFSCTDYMVKNRNGDILWLLSDHA